MSLDPRIRVCAVCARVLDYCLDADDAESGWRHTIGTVMDGVDDHPAVPVSPSEIHTVGFCDFCYAPDPPLEIPARDFIYPGPRLPGQTDGSAGSWGCCEPCAALVDSNQWSRLIRRCVDGHQRRFGEPLPELAVQMVSRVHRVLRRNITGPARPSTLPRPPSR